MTVSLRAHHLLCLVTYLGKGYTLGFVTNYDRIVRRLNGGEPVRIVDGADDLCVPMLQEAACHCHNESVRQRDLQAATDVGKLLGIDLHRIEDLHLDADKVKRMRHAFAAGSLRTACAGCEWQGLCTEIAQNDFRGCRLAPPE